RSTNFPSFIARRPNVDSGIRNSEQKAAISARRVSVVDVALKDKGTYPHGQGETSLLATGDACGSLFHMNERRQKLNRELRRRMEALSVSAKKLSLDAGLSETAVKDILSGKSENPKHDTLAKIAKRLACTVAINELDVHAAAGIAGDDGEAILASDEPGLVTGVHTYPAASFREAYGINPGNIRIIPVRGNSMEPELWSGQRVMVDVDDRSPSPPGIFVVSDGLGLVLKYVGVIADSEPVRVRISSAHQAFKPYERNLDEAYINGRVVGVWKRL